MCPLSPSLVGLLAKVILVLNIMDRSLFSGASLSSDPALRTQLKARNILIRITDNKNILFY